MNRLFHAHGEALQDELARLEKIRQLVEERPIAGGASVFDADVILLANTATFDEGDDGTHAAVTVEPRTAWLVRVQISGPFNNADNTLDVDIEASDDEGATFRVAHVFEQITNAMVITNGQTVFYGYVVVPQTVAGFTTCRLRAITDAAGTAPDLGTVGIACMSADLAGNYPTGVVGRNLIPDTIQRFA